MRVLVTGAGGFVGRHLVADLRRHGHDAVTYARGAPASDDPRLFAGPAELADMGSWPAWPQGVDAVVHLAAIFNGRSGTSDADLARVLAGVNVEGTRALAARARRENVSRIVFLSTLHVHGLTGGAPHRESDQPAPRSAYAASKLAAEVAFWDALGEDRRLGTVLRPAPVFGPGGRGRMAAVVRLARSPVPLPLEGLGGPKSVVAVDHLAAIIRLSLDCDAARGETLLVAEDDPVRPAEIVRACREGRGKPARLLPARLGLLRLAARASGREALWQGLSQPDVADTRRLAAILGWRSPMPTAQKIRQMAAAGEL